MSGVVGRVLPSGSPLEPACDRTAPAGPTGTDTHRTWDHRQEGPERKGDPGLAWFGHGKLRAAGPCAAMLVPFRVCFPHYPTEPRAAQPAASRPFQICGANSGAQQIL